VGSGAEAARSTHKSFYPPHFHSTHIPAAADFTSAKATAASYSFLSAPLSSPSDSPPPLNLCLSSPDPRVLPSRGCALLEEGDRLLQCALTLEDSIGAPVIAYGEAVLCAREVDEPRG